MVKNWCAFGLIFFCLIVLQFCFPAISAATEDDFLNLINMERTSLGKNNLSLNSQLTNASFLHSKDMVDNDYFSHTSLDGRTFVQRINNAGYSGYFTIGENLAYHSGTENAATVFDMWKNSAPHYANMIYSSFNEMGLGIYTGDYAGMEITMYTLDLGGRTISCTSGNNETRICGSDVGECVSGTQNRSCISGQWSSWSSCIEEIAPTIESCDNLDNDCDNLADENLDCVPLELTINNPQNNSLFFSSSVLFDLTLSKRIKVFNITDNNRKIYSCYGCGNISRTLYLLSGFHNLTLTAQEYNLNISRFFLSLRVYIPNLRISAVFPSSPSVSTPFGKNSRFSITYTSNLPLSGKVTVISQNYSETIMNNCSNGTNIRCYFQPLSLPDNLGDRVNVTFELKDEFNFSARKNNLALIDTREPNMTLNITKTNSSTIKTFRIRGYLTEYSKVEYANATSTYRLVCTMCTTFYNYFSFVNSATNIETNFRLTDRANNSVIKTIYLN